MMTPPKIGLALGVTAFLCLAVGLLVGRFALCPKHGAGGTFLPGVPAAIIQEGDAMVSALLRDSLDKRKIEDYLREYSSQPHIAGSPREHALARKIHHFWLDAGMDDVQMTPYDVLLSFPDTNEPNVVHLLNSSGEVIYETPLTEDILTPEENRTDVVPPFNAYSAHGTVQGDLVYVNYGRVEDYAWLDSNANINVSGKIVIARYGKIFRGSKVKIAERHGAIGLILYSDPADYTAGNDRRVYPRTWWLPPTGVQRGSTLLEGDILTPGYPAVASAYRLKESEVNLPKIPVHAIGYGAAQQLLGSLGGRQAPDEWHGRLNIAYHLGPNLTSEGGSVVLKVSTKTHRKLIYNVIGIIRGAVEPDRYVMFGNHRDAWVFGATDPSSGTAVLLEVSRAMTALVKSGKWRPRRSIVFCSWGAEEFGLIGSNEWTEHYIKNLQNRAVAYINVDTAVMGNHSLRANGSPLLIQALYAAAKAVPTPDRADLENGLNSVYDKWSASFPEAKGSILPLVGVIGSGSDYAPLLHKAGIPAVDFRYTYDSTRLRISDYPLYHSVYDTFHAMKNLVDRRFDFHLAVARVGIELARHLADSLILPFHLRDYASQLADFTNSVLAAYGDKLRRRLANVDDLDVVITNFTHTVRDFEKRLATVNKHHPLLVRMVNDQLMLLEKAFLDPNGLPGRPQSKHVIYAESSVDSYAGSGFPGLVDLLADIDGHSDSPKRWERVKQHYATLIFTIQSAASTLKDVTKFVSDHL